MERKMSDYYEYYYMNPHEKPVTPEYDLEEKRNLAFFDMVDEMDGNDFLDAGLAKDTDAFLSDLKYLALAWDRKDDKEVKARAEHLAYLMISQINDYVEREIDETT
jgi:hypothetical protein